MRIVVDNKRLEAGQEVTFQCLVYGARPQPSISWSLIESDSFSDLNVNNVNSQDNFIDNELSSSSTYFEDSNWFTKQHLSSTNGQTPNGVNLKNSSRTTERFKSSSTNSNAKSNLNNSSNSKLTNSFITESTASGLSFETARKAAINQVLSESENIHSSQIRFRLNEK